MQGWDRHSSPGGPNTQFAINSCFYKMRSKCKCNFQVLVNILRLGKKPQIHKTQIFQGVRMERCLEDLMLVIPVLLWSLALFFFFLPPENSYLGLILYLPKALISPPSSFPFCFQIFIEPFIFKALFYFAISLSVIIKYHLTLFPRLICWMRNSGSFIFPSQKPLFKIPDDFLLVEAKGWLVSFCNFIFPDLPLNFRLDGYAHLETKPLNPPLRSSSASI